MTPPSEIDASKEHAAIVDVVTAHGSREPRGVFRADSHRWSMALPREHPAVANQAFQEADAFWIAFNRLDDTSDQRRDRVF
jgi:hypothetical protein